MTAPPPEPANLAALWQQGTARLGDAGLADARLVAEVLLREAAGLSRTGLLRDLREPPGAGVSCRYASLLARAGSGEPLAYITGRREFYGLEFKVDRRVLIPRPETETLVERAIATARWLALDGTARPNVVDVGVGSGAVALALAHALPDAAVIGYDVSADALQLAACNRERLGLTEQVHFARATLLTALRRRVPLTVANLPYIPRDRIASLPANVRDWEPHLALDGGPDGLDLYRRLMRQWVGLPGGGPAALLFEIGADQADGAAGLVRDAGHAGALLVHTDAGGQARVVEARLG